MPSNYKLLWETMKAKYDIDNEDIVASLNNAEADVVILGWDNPKRPHEIARYTFTPPDRIITSKEKYIRERKLMTMIQILELEQPRGLSEKDIKNIVHAILSGKAHTITINIYPHTIKIEGLPQQMENESISKFTQHITPSGNTHSIPLSRHL